MNKRNNKRPALQKEKISIIAASVFVLSALTLAGVYMSAQGDKKKEENRIDFAKLEQENNTAEEGGTGLADTRFVSGKAQAEMDTKKQAQIDKRFVESDMYDLSDNNDMDVDPAFTEANSGQVENTRQTRQPSLWKDRSRNRSSWRTHRCFSQRRIHLRYQSSAM